MSLNRNHFIKFTLLALFVLVGLVWHGEASAGVLQLSWADNSDNEHGFKIERKAGTTGTYAQVASVGQNVTSYGDLNLMDGTTYCYRISAFNSTGSSPYSPEACGVARATVQTYTLTVVKAGTGSGTVTSSPAGINCGNDCSESYNSTTIVALAAAPAASSTFAGWSGTGCASSVTMSADRNCTATFNAQTTSPSGSSTLLVNFGKTSTLNSFGLSGWSTVIKDIYTDYRDLGPGGTTIVVGDNYSYNYQGVAGTLRNFVTGEKIVVTWYNNSATAATFIPKISFNDGDRIGMGATGTWYSMSSATVPPFGTASTEYAFTSVSAGFHSLVNVNANYSNHQLLIADKIELLPIESSPSPAPTTYTVIVAKAGTGNGTVTSSPAGINCGNDCSEQYNSGTTVALTATPAAASTFAGWSGTGCTNGAVTMNGSKTCSATFNVIPQQFTLNVNVVKTVTNSGTGNGSVTSAPAGISCGGDCSEIYNSGTLVTLTATPAAGSIFAGWSGTGCAKGVVTIDASKTCTATFTPIVTTFSFLVTKVGNGTITSVPAGINCGTDCSESYTSGTSVTLSATAAEGFNFAGWSGGCTGVGNCTVSVAANTSVTATFAQHNTARIGIFRPDTGEWYLDVNGNGIWDGCNVDRCIKSSAREGDYPIIADWMASGTDAIGIFRPNEVQTGLRRTKSMKGIWRLDFNNNGNLESCDVDRCFGPFGDSGDRPVLGDFTGTGSLQIGVFRSGTKTWYLDRNGNKKFDGCGKDRCFDSFGEVGNLPVTGDWTGTGIARIGVFDPDTGTWHLDLNGNIVFDGCAVDACLSFGQPEDLPVVGDWNGSGTAKIGVFRPTTGDWFLDLNGNGKWDGCNVDKCLTAFGQGGDLPVTGK